MNIVISVLMVRRFGLIGISVGTFLAMLYRTAYQVWYLSRNILMRSWTVAVRKLLHFLPVPVLGVLLSHAWMRRVHPVRFGGWILEAALVFAAAAAATLAVDLLFYRSDTVRCCKCFLGKDHG